MPIRDAIKSIVEGHTADADGNVKEGRRRACDQLGRLFEANKIPITDFSLRILFENFVGGDINDMSDEQVAEAITHSYFPTITTKALLPYVMPAYTEGLGSADQLVTEVPGLTDLRDTPVPGLTAADTVELTPEGQNFTEASLGEKLCYIEMCKFGKIISVTKEAIARDKTGQLVTRVRGFAGKAGMTRHQIIVQKTFGIACTKTKEAATRNFRYNGTATAIFSNDHSAVDGPTNDNLITTAFSQAAINELFILLMKMQDEKSDTIMNWPTHLCVPTALYMQALEILTSVGKSETANRADNVVARLFAGTPNLFSSPVLDANNAGLWYLGRPKDQTLWIWQAPFAVVAQGADSEKSFEADVVMRVKVSFAGNAGCIDYKHLGRGGA